MNDHALPVPGRRGEAAVLVLILLFALVPRVVHLSADPPVRISPTSCGDYGDPASYASSARNRVLFGHSKVDDLDAMVGSPVGHTATYAIFSLLGVGMRQMNLQPVLFSVLIFGLLFYFAKAYFPDARRLFFLLLLANYPFVIYGRIANQAMPMTLFAVLGLFLFLKGWDKPGYFYLSALSLGLSFMAKGKIVYFLLIVMPLAALILLVLRREAGRVSLNLRRLGCFAAGALTAFLPWLFFVYLPGRDFLKEFGGLNAAAMFPRTPTSLVQNWLLKPPLTFYPTNRLLSLVLFLYFLWLLLRVFNAKGRRSVLALEVVCSLWFLVGVIGNSVVAYRPTRHYIEMTIPMIILASLFLSRALSGIRVEFLPRLRALFYAALFVLLWVAVSSFRPLLFSELAVFEHPYRCLLILTGLAGAALGGPALLIERAAAKSVLSIPRRIAAPAVLVALALYCAQNALEYGRWIKGATYNLKTISRDFGRAFPGTVFCGLEAPAVSMENRNVAHIWFPNFANSRVPDFLKAAKVKYLFLADFNREAVYYWQAFPEVMRRTRWRARYRLWVSWFDLYEIEGAPVPEEVDNGTYEAEKLDRDAGTPLFDPVASNQFVVRAGPSEEGAVLQKKVPLKPGETLDGRLWVKPGTAGGTGPHFLIQLNIGKGIHYRRYVRIDEAGTGSGGGWQVVPFKVSIPRTRELVYNLKVIALGNSGFAVDRLELRVNEPRRADEAFAKQTGLGDGR